VGGPLAQDLFGDHRGADHLAEKVDDVLRPRETGQVAVNDDAVEAVINKHQPVAEQPGKEFYGQPHDTRPRSETD
jgi:hypothetical protein